jgi:hypothetical protein
LGVSFFLLIGIGIIYYRARRNRFRLSAGVSGAAPTASDSMGSPDTPTSTST